MSAAHILTARGALSLAISMAATGVAAAQEPVPMSSLATLLQAGVPCTLGDASRYLAMNASRSAASTRDLINALGELSINLDVCAPIRTAASEQAAGLSDTGLGADPLAVEMARERVTQTFQEAETHAGTMRFEVGPPPRNLTRGHGGSP